MRPFEGIFSFMNRKKVTWDKRQASTVDVPTMIFGFLTKESLNRNYSTGKRFVMMRYLLVMTKI
jgi:hypothetical protein